MSSAAKGVLEEQERQHMRKEQRKTISILGCGWLGLPLGEALIERGYQVKGSTTTPEKLDRLRAAGIRPFLLRLEPTLEGDDAEAFFDTDLLFLNVPPPRGRDDVIDYHRRQIESVRSALRAAPIDWVIFASSTSVYPEANRVVEEDDAGDSARPTGEALLAAERLLQEDTSFDTTVLRFAGLYGYDRQPGRFLAGRKGVEGGRRPVNLIHRDDCIGIVEAVIGEEARGEVFNACADEHPARKNFYQKAAERAGLEPPTFADEAKDGFKVVSNRKLKERLGYHFQHPDPMAEAP